MGEQEALHELVNAILDQARPVYSVRAEIDALSELLGRQATFHIDPKLDISDGETRTDDGLAISPTQAAMCAGEVARTVTFIRGLRDAIRDAGDRIQDRPVRVLYAGCGPFALLAIPQMTQFSAEQVQFTLLDLHQTSIDSSNSVVDSFGFESFVSAYCVADAARYQIPEKDWPDILVSETMSHCLENEPLVAIARNLVPQAPTAIMIPQSVRVEACLMGLAHEFRFCETDDGSDCPVPNRDRVFLGTVFELSAEQVKTWSAVDGDRLPASSVQVPPEIDDRYEPKLQTIVQVYADSILQDYSCGLTIPRPIPSKAPLTGGEMLNFYYQLGSLPGLAIDA